MDNPVDARAYESRDSVDRAGRVDLSTESRFSAISWRAILAGAVAAAAVSLILLALGTGLGLASVSPWSSNPSITTFSIMTAIWLIVAQWLASGLGGYLTGRLRTKWVDLHSHEIFFRDTAHGFLAWAVAAIVVACLAASVVGGGVRATTTVAAAGVQGAAAGASTVAATSSDYTTDTMFRSSQSDANGLGDARAEAARILANGVTSGDVPATDRTYLAGLIATRTGIPQADAEKRVDEAVAESKAAAAKARDAANQARKAASAFAFFTALSMVIGAFIACVAAAFGGRLRDEHAYPAPRTV